VLVLGGGSAGTRHARNLRSLGAEVTVADVDFDLRTVPGFDGMVVATPSALHRDHAIAALASGATVLVEKPLATSVDGLDELVRAAGNRLTVGYNLRLHTPVERVRDLVVSGRVGTVALVRVWFGSWLPDWRPHVDYRGTYSARAALGGGVLFDASHELDLLGWLFGFEWTVTGASLMRRSSLDIDVEDTALALLRSADGLPAVVTLDMVSRRYRRGIEIVGDEAAVRLDWARGVIEVEHARGVDVEDASVGIDASYEREAAAFLELVCGRAGPLVTATEGAATVRLCAAIRTAAGSP
jgi:predicted dehydrogenase